MAVPTVEFTTVTSLGAEAIGEPGERTFRVLVEGAGGSAVIWLEKDQLLQLALALNQLLATLPDVKDAPTDQPQEEAGSAQLDFKVGRLVLGHDASSGRFVIDAHDVEAGEEGPATVRLWSHPFQVKVFADEALKVCASGRPLCPLCGGPIDKAGHRCPRTNGHGVAPLGDL